MKKPKNIPTYYQSKGTPVYRDTTGLPFEDGGKITYYKYGNTPNNYRKQGNQWYISNKTTDFKFVPIHDPTGNRAKELNKNAVVDPDPWKKDKGFEGKINAVLGDPQGQAARAAQWHTPAGEDQRDNLRHGASGYTTAKAIENLTGSKTLGYFGSVGLGAAHELGTIFSDPRSWSVAAGEAYEDMRNNTRGAEMAYFGTKNPIDKLANMSNNYMMPDGYGGVKPFPGSNWTDPYDKIQRLKAQQEVWNNPNPKPVSLTEKFADGGPINNSGPVNNQIINNRIPSTNSDYDLRAYYANNPMGAEAFMAGKGNAPDTYKLPTHPTFGNESIYSNQDTPGGKWSQDQSGNWSFTPSWWNIQNAGGKEALQEWWKESPSQEGTTLNLADGGPLVDKTNHGKLLNSVYASALGNYYAQGGMIKRADGSYSQRGLWDNIRAKAASNKRAGKEGKEPTEEMLAQERKINREYRTGGQFPRPYSLPEDSFRQGGNNLHNSVYASSMAQYPGIYAEGGILGGPGDPRSTQSGGTFDDIDKAIKRYNALQAKVHKGNNGRFDYTMDEVNEIYKLEKVLQKQLGKTNDVHWVPQTKDYQQGVLFGNYDPLYKKYLDKKISFTPPEIADIDYSPIEPEARWTNPDPWNDIEPTKKYPKLYLPNYRTGVWSATGRIDPNQKRKELGQLDLKGQTFKYGGSFDMPRQQMYMPLDNVERNGGPIKTSQLLRNGGSVLSMSNTPQLEGEGKDLTYPDGAYVYDGGGTIRISPFSYHGDTPGLYRFSTHNPTFNIGYSQPFGERVAKNQGFDSFRADVTARLPYKPNTGIGGEGNFHVVASPKKGSSTKVEADLSAGWDPNVGFYSNLIASPQFTFGNVSPTKAKMYGTGLHGGEYLAKVGPFIGASFTPKPQAYKGHLKNPEAGGTIQAGGMPFGVKGNIDFGLGRKGVRAGVSGYAGADLMGIGLEQSGASEATIAKTNQEFGKLAPRFNYGLQGNVTIPIKSAKDYVKNIVEDKKAQDAKIFNNYDYVSAPSFKNGGVIKTSHLFDNGGNKKTITSVPTEEEAYLASKSTKAIPYADKAVNLPEVKVTPYGYRPPATAADILDAGYNAEMQKKADWERRSSGRAGDADWVWTLPIGASSAGLRGLTALGEAAAPVLTRAMATQLPGMSGVAGATWGNAANLAGWTTAGLHSFPEAYKGFRQGDWDKGIGNLTEGLVLTAEGWMPTLSKTPQILKKSLNKGQSNFSDFVQTPFLDQTIGSIKNKGRQEQLREAENWMKEWVQHPATQEKILNSYKKALEGKKLSAVERHNLDEMIKFSSGYNPTNRLGEYPLLRQGLWKNNIHSDNAGVSYTHEELPGQILNPAENTYIDPRVEIKPLDNDIINFAIQNDPHYGNWISRTLSPEKRISTGIHELGHDWIKDYTLKNTELGNMLKSSVDEFKVQEILDKYAGTSLENKAKEEIEYLTDPTEIYSRLFEARRHFGLKPGQVITKNQAGDYLDAIAAGSTPITPVFGKLVARGKKAADLFNNPWAWTGVAAGTALSNQKKQGGVIKTSDLIR